MKFLDENDGLKVTLVDRMGSDLTVVNAARVSFLKKSDTFEERDEKLIKYLASHNHWTPFSHPHLMLHMKAPIFVARQLFKHKVGLTENEISRRYVDSPPEFFLPTEWRGKPLNKKQGSSDIIISNEVTESVSAVLGHGTKLYHDLIDSGVAPEQARMVLPQNMITEWYWTGSLAAFARVVHLRNSPDAQKESQIIAGQIKDIMVKEFPVSTRYLTGE